MSNAHDTLESLQTELDDLLKRMASRMAKDLGEEVTTAEVAKVVYCYAVDPDAVARPQPLTLRRAWVLVGEAQARQRDRFDALCKEHGRRKGALMASLAALQDWPELAPCPLSPDDMYPLVDESDALADGITQYFGQGAGLELLPARTLERNKRSRRLAAILVERANRSDPKSYPIGDELFGEVAKRIKILRKGKLRNPSASFVRDAYYHPEEEGRRARGAQLISAVLEGVTGNTETL
ncbi:hypothetical protein [Halomonas alkalicola]|uniref:hypothetical protein n=1 Tax=Halomonas alkalicola TaxID=1930622 RepID=UPI00265E842B|nr:hypothetical protein [Halomonas alkalicola]